MALNPLLRVSGPPLIVLITIASSCGFLLFGYDNGKSRVSKLCFRISTYDQKQESSLALLSSHGSSKRSTSPNRPFWALFLRHTTSAASWEP